MLPNRYESLILFLQAGIIASKARFFQRVLRIISRLRKPMRQFFSLPSEERAKKNLGQPFCWNPQRLTGQYLHCA